MNPSCDPDLEAMEHVLADLSADARAVLDRGFAKLLRDTVRVLREDIAFLRAQLTVKDGELRATRAVMKWEQECREDRARRVVSERSAN